MAKFAKLLIVIVCCAVFALFFIREPHGKTFLSLSQISADLSNLSSTLTQQLTKTLAKEVPREQTEAPSTVYKWQDEQGSWHFSDQANDTSQVVIVSANSSITTTAVAAPPTVPAQPMSTPEKTIAPFSTALETLQDAKNLQSLVDPHGARLDRAIQQQTK
ncbi:MAG: hypothetical protein ACI86X_001354 [Moritella sp.]|jgi:hypothetical protein